MTRRLFGTDGIRGVANTHPMTADVALAVGKAAGRMFRRGDHAHRVVIGKDTRLRVTCWSPPLTSGFICAGMDVMLLGPMPTPAVAFLTRSLRADIGVMVSASHNPFHDNGIKLFGPDGYKLSDEIEAEIERQVEATAAAAWLRPKTWAGPNASRTRVGATSRISRAASPGPDARRPQDRGRCRERRGLSDRTRTLLGAWRRDRAHRHVAERLQHQRRMWSTHPEAVREAVLDTARRSAWRWMAMPIGSVLVDERGDTVDGDQVLALVARSWQADGRLRGGAVAAT